MKRYIPFLLTALLLCGCTAKSQPEPQTEPTTIPESSEILVMETTAPQITETTAPVLPDGLYDSESYLESFTNGALQVYPLNRSDAVEIVRMGEDLLLFSGEKATTLTRLSGDTRYISAVANLNLLIRATDPAVNVSEKGVTYFDETTRELVFLDANLKEGTRFPMPADMVGSPALSANRKNLYYHTGNTLRTIDLDSGLNMLIREMAYPVDNILALHCSDTILSCQVTDSYGKVNTLFLSVKTGETLWETQDELYLATNGAQYFARHVDGIYPEYLVGLANEWEYLLQCNGFDAIAHPVLEANGIVMQSTGEQETTILEFCNLENGKRTSQLEYPGLVEPASILVDSQGTGIWFLCYEEAYGGHILCHWEPARSTIADDRIYLTKRFTPEDPDWASLGYCQSLAEEFLAKHGISVLIGTDALWEASNLLTLETEHQAWTIEYALLALEEMMTVYPKDMVDQLAGPTGSPLRICLVRNFDSRNADEDLSCLLYRDANADPYIFLALEEDWEADFHHQLFHVIESYVIMSCPTLDSWNSLNPKKFQYTLQHMDEATDALQAFLEDGSFVNLYATSFPKEDRAMTFISALETGNESIFESKVMQSKLKLLSTGIRKAFGYQKSTQTFLWEQYLK